MRYSIPMWSFSQKRAEILETEPELPIDPVAEAYEQMCASNADLKRACEELRSFEVAHGIIVKKGRINQILRADSRNCRICSEWLRLTQRKGKCIARFYKDTSVWSERVEATSAAREIVADSTEVTT